MCRYEKSEVKIPRQSLVVMVTDCDSRNIAYSGKSIYLKTHLGLFLFIQNDFLQYIAHGIMSYIITDKMHWESR